MLKFIGVIFVILGTTYYGFYLSFKQTSRIKRLKAFKNTLSLLEGQIRYAYTSIPEAFISIADKTDEPVLHDFYLYVSSILQGKECEDFSEAWNDGMKKYILDCYLNRSDCAAVKIVGTMPVYLDGDMQIKVISEAGMELENLIKDAELHIKEKCKIYQYTGFIAGVFIVLVLI